MKGKPVIVTIVILIVLLVGAGIAYFALAPQIEGTSPISADSQISSNSGESATTSSAESASTDDPQAPNFTVLNQQGDEVSLDSMKGKPIILNFWTSWCTYCNQEMPDFEKAYEKYGEEINFMIINSTTDSKETMAKAEAYIENHGFDLPFYFDTTGQATKLYQITAFPTSFFIDAVGYVVAYQPGKLDWESLDGVCQALLRE